MYLCDTTNVLVPVLLRKSQIFVEAKTNVVAIQTVGSKAQVQEMLLQSGRHGRLARGREASQPNGEATLATQLITLMAGKRRVPCNVPTRSTRFDQSRRCALDRCEEDGGSHEAKARATQWKSPARYLEDARKLQGGVIIKRGVCTHVAIVEVSTTNQ